MLTYISQQRECFCNRALLFVAVCSGVGGVLMRDLVGLFWGKGGACCLYATAHSACVKTSFLGTFGMIVPPGPLLGLGLVVGFSRVARCGLGCDRAVQLIQAQVTDLLL
jgi:hypothetical protein